MTTVRIVLSTIDDAERAADIAETLVNERLAACVNIIPEVTSVYKWKGRLERSSELLLVIKTRQELMEALSRRLAALHPYDLPEIIATKVEGGSSTYLNWVIEQTGRGPE